MMNINEVVTLVKDNDWNAFQEMDSDDRITLLQMTALMLYFNVSECDFKIICDEYHTDFLYEAERQDLTKLPLLRSFVDRRTWDDDQSISIDLKIHAQDLVYETLEYDPLVLQIIEMIK